MKKLTKQLFKLLSIHSPSGKEWAVSKYLLPILKDTLDCVWIDSYGNLYGEKRYGNSDYTVLLNAHMDTVAHYPPIPKWRKNKTEIYNMTGLGALGGDDKCGIAAHLTVIRMLNRSTDFKGTLKVLFTRQEEVGCVGASQAVKLHPEWFEGIDIAIVVDRRGGDNIIHGGWSENYCHENFSQFWSDMANVIGFKGIPQEGTISDTMIFAEHGINSINLSAGYYEAHTKDEYIKIDELKRTVQWVYTAINHIEQYGKFPSFEYDNYDASAWWKKGKNYWMGGKKYSETTTDTAAYCDCCGELWDTFDMVEEDDFYFCPDCIESEVYEECVYCNTLKPLDELVEIRDHNVCFKCMSDIEGVV